MNISHSSRDFDLITVFKIIASIVKSTHEILRHKVTLTLKVILVAPEPDATSASLPWPEEEENASNSLLASLGLGVERW